MNWWSKKKKDQKKTAPHPLQKNSQRSESRIVSLEDSWGLEQKGLASKKGPEEVQDFLSKRAAEPEVQGSPPNHFEPCSFNDQPLDFASAFKMSSSQRPAQPPPVSDGDSAGTPMAAAAPPPLGPTLWISFAGAPNETAAAFIQAVQRIAFMQNRVKDDEWIAEYASACFSDSALMWYLTLDEDTQTNWKKLRLALAQRYPVQPAAPPPAARPTTASARPKATSPAITEIGRIEVVRPEFGDFFGYLSQDSTGNFVVAPGPENALKLKAVLHTNSKNQQEKIYSLRILAARDSRYPFLGLRLVKFLREDPDVVPEIKPRDIPETGSTGSAKYLLAANL
ncbi:hypothetical protein FRC00_002958 [Tulasnella sp. 408]|nr:hypothetical protein FRC00_002958 [Tulasnella sp. 408]